MDKKGWIEYFKREYPYPDKDWQRNEAFIIKALTVLGCTFKGLHNVPGKIKLEYGGQSVILNIFRDMSTWDDNELTKLVVNAHDECVRVSISPNMRYLKIMLSDRKREGMWHETHPTMEEAVKAIRGKGWKECL